MKTTAASRTVAIATVLITISFGTSACGGSSGANGTYYTKGVNGTSNLGQLVVDGDTLTHHEYDCDGVDEEEDVTSRGKLNSEKNQVVWVAGDDIRNDRKGAESVAIVDDSISVGGEVYLRDDSTSGRGLLDEFKAACGTNAESAPAESVQVRPTSLSNGTFYAGSMSALTELTVDGQSISKRAATCPNLVVKDGGKQVDASQLKIKFDESGTLEKVGDGFQARWSDGSPDFFEVSADGYPRQDTQTFYPKDSPEGKKAVENFEKGGTAYGPNLMGCGPLPD